MLITLGRLRLKITVRLLCVVLPLIAIAGCATTGPFKEFTTDVQRLRIGMTEAEVRAALGPPESSGYWWKDQEGIFYREWDYRRKGHLGQDLHLTVTFKEGQVLHWEEWRPALNL